MFVESFADFFDDMVRHRRIDLAGQMNKACREVVFFGFPRKIKGINRYAVSAKPRSRIEGRVSERFGAGRVNDFPDVDVHALTQQFELVDEGNVYRAVDVL